jgi:hypothetical protein
VREVEGTTTDIGAATAFCGTLSSAADVDVFTFTMPATAKSFSWSGSFSAGGETITISAGGQTATMSETPPWFPGQVYTVTITGAALDYGVTLNIGQ